jgi:methyl-accepting chemotaxis protein
MQTLFAPAIALLNRLGYTKKFTVMGMLALIAIGLLAVNLYHVTQRVIDRSQQRAGRSRNIKPIATLVQHLQVHRGLSSGVLNGDEKMEYRRAAREKRACRRSWPWRIRGRSSSPPGRRSRRKASSCR